MARTNNVFLPSTRVPADLRERLEEIAREQGPDTTLADVMRQALRAFVASHDEEELRSHV